MANYKDSFLFNKPNSSQCPDCGTKNQFGGTCNECTKKRIEEVKKKHETSLPQSVIDRAKKGFR